MIRIPEYLAVAQWVLLLSLGVLVTLMFRQLGRNLAGQRPAAGMGPASGTPAAAIAYAPAGGGGERLFRPGGGRPALLAFVDPTCPSCEELVSVLNAADRAGDLAGVEPLLLTSEPASYLEISEPFRLTRLPVGRMLSDSTLAAYRVTATPLLVAVDSAGLVRAAGPATRRADVASFLRACVLPVPDRGTLPVAPSAQDGSGRDMMSAIAGEEG